MNKKSGRYGLVWIFVALAVAGFTAFPTRAASAGSVIKIEEPALDAKIGNKNNQLVVVFMAAWCAPCIDELPTLNKLYQKFKDQGLEIIGISIDLDGPDAMQPIVSDLKISFPIYWFGEKAVEKFALFAIPMMFLVKEGEIVERIHGRRPDAFFDLKFQDFVK